MIGKKFGKLYVNSLNVKRSKNYRKYYNCYCDCGDKKVVRRDALVSGDTRSCGCLLREMSGKRSKTHVMSKTRIYSIWKCMIQRCGLKSTINYDNYGGRGIKVCKRWHKFKNFFADMGEPPTSKHSIDRINTNRNYKLSNCKWSTPKEQGRNKRNNTLIEYKGETKTLAEWSEITKISRTKLKYRLDKGFSIGDFLK